MGKNNNETPPRGSLVAIGMMTAIMPMEIFIEKLEESLQAFKVVSNENTQMELKAAMSGMMLKLKSEGKNPMEFMKELSNIESEDAMVKNFTKIGQN